MDHKATPTHTLFHSISQCVWLIVYIYLASLFPDSHVPWVFVLNIISKGIDVVHWAMTDCDQVHTSVITPNWGSKASGGESHSSGDISGWCRIQSREIFDRLRCLQITPSLVPARNLGYADHPLLVAPGSPGIAELRNRQIIIISRQWMGLLSLSASFSEGPESEMKIFYVLGGWGQQRQRK